MRVKTKVLALFAGLFLLWGVYPPQACAGKIDVYLVYTGRNKREKDKLKKVLAQNFKVKAYNADLLAIADYSGKQKAVSKLSRAGIVVILMDKPMKLLKGSEFKKDLLVVKSVKTTVKSTALRIYVLSKGTDFSPIGKNAAKLDLPQDKSQLRRDKLQSVEVVLVDETSMDIHQAVHMIVDQFM